MHVHADSSPVFSDPFRRVYSISWLWLVVLTLTALLLAGCGEAVYPSATAAPSPTVMPSYTRADLTFTYGDPGPHQWAPRAAGLCIRPAPAGQPGYLAAQHAYRRAPGANGG